MSIENMARNVKRLRKLRKYSLSKLSAQTGLSRATLYKIESGKHDFKVGSLAKIAKVLDIPEAMFMSE